MLCVVTGDIIVGLEPLNSHWWQATLNGETGIIPLTHVVELHSSDDVHLCNLWSPAAESSDDLKSSVNSRVVGSTVVAESDLTAQLDHELTFCRGDVIYVLEDLGDGFAIGECSGAVGQFPLCFCTPADPQTIASLPSPEKPPSINAVSQTSSPSWKKCYSRLSSYTLENTRSQDCSVIPYCVTLYEFRGRSSGRELSFGAGEIVHLISHLDDDWCFGELDGNCGAFPTSYVDIIVDCDAAGGDQVQPELAVEAAAAVPMVTQILPSSQEASCGSVGTDLYGRLLCDFVAVNVNEVDASEGETVTVLQCIDKDWLEVRHDNGKVGLCPASFVELFGAEPKPTVKPDVRTSSVVKPKLPVKPKLLIAGRSATVSSANIGQNTKSPVSANLPVFSPEPIRTQPDNNSSLSNAGNIVRSPTTETVKSTSVTNSFSTSGQSLSRGLSLDEFIEAQLTPVKSTPTAGVRAGKPSNQQMTSDYPAGVTLNGVANVAGQSAWYRFTETEQVNTAAVARKPPPPARPAPSRPPQIAAAPSCGSKNGLDAVGGLAAPRKPMTNLIEFSPDHTQGKCRIDNLQRVLVKFPGQNSRSKVKTNSVS